MQYERNCHQCACRRETSIYNPDRSWNRRFELLKFQRSQNLKKIRYLLFPASNLLFLSSYDTCCMKPRLTLQCECSYIQLHVQQWFSHSFSNTRRPVGKVGLSELIRRTLSAAYRIRLDPSCCRHDFGPKRRNHVFEDRICVEEVGLLFLPCRHHHQ